jgi:streptogramin lyase
MPGSGPRRFDIGKDGKVWIPMFGYGALGKLDPATGNVFHYLLPVSSSAPYVARVNRRTGQVWVATGAADMVFMFDPARARWTEYPLPTRGALVTSMEIDARTGAIWMTYGASPGIAPRVARLVIAR